MNENHRMLVACLRVGRFAKTSLIAGDKICANLVMMCAEKPTMALLYKVYELLPKHSEVISIEFQFGLIKLILINIPFYFI